MTKKLNCIRGAIFVLLALMWSVLLFFPMPHALAAGTERYSCRWSDGTVTEESYADAYRDLTGMDENGAILLERSELTGTVEAGAQCLAAVKILEEGGLKELLTADIGGLARLERAALYRRFRSRVWYAGEYFEWTGEKLAHCGARQAEELVLLSGSISSVRLKETAAKTLFLRSEASFEASDLADTQVERVIAEEPYGTEGNVIVLTTPGGKRLISGIPAARSVCVPADVAWADEGALLFCSSLEEVQVPFAGNAASAVVTGYRGEFAHLFSSGKVYRVPETLKKVRVTGGCLVSHAFYGCGGLQEIDACGVSPADIEPDAFSDCTHLLRLHTPRPDVRLNGNFRSFVAPCGCTVYESVA